MSKEPGLALNDILETFVRVAHIDGVRKVKQCCQIYDAQGGGHETAVWGIVILMRGGGKVYLYYENRYDESMSYSYSKLKDDELANLVTDHRAILACINEDKT